jgi:hypothetical protein
MGAELFRAERQIRCFVVLVPDSLKDNTFEQPRQNVSRRTYNQ